jgi:hypothetical protein
MPQLPLPLPTNRAFVVQLRAQPPGPVCMRPRKAHSVLSGYEQQLSLVTMATWRYNAAPG